ncbi:alpha-L-rhamnosidase [Evansella caseinilytica]|uniref:alpha-L-rhamnosidase n=1 Tax=Evansella caseinilytica TaxID=1503961 RepID=A0A1H3HHC7_9BACI|nr:alpha-L-rhamnosidase [Evansella caseinilytica]SDY14861.1 alpha-L-rhamnosidase [Evansella caseinilytica]
MQITNLRTNGIKNPLGFQLDRISLSWVTESSEAPSKFQAAAQVEIATDESFSEIIFDSGKREEIDSLAYSPDLLLSPRTRYYWRATVWGDQGDTATSEVSWFETAKMDEGWQGQWITPLLDNETHPLIRRRFHLADEVQSARVYVSGVGLYELEVNGCRVGEEYFTPGFNAYDFWLQYQTYDVTNLLRSGDNAIGIHLGNGMYKGRFGFDGGYHEIYGSKFAVIAEMVVVLRDGSTMVIGTDDNWKCAASPVQFSGIYDGEIFDATKELSGWSTAEFNDHHWTGVAATDLPSETFQARLSLPVLIKEERKPIEVIKTPKGETVLDFGQNMTGWVRFKIQAPKGRKVTLQYGEILQEGCFYRENLRTAKAEYTYISDGDERIVQPHFSFYGFRYVNLIGFADEVKAGDFTGCVIYSDIDETGRIETSNPLVNQLFENAMWGQKGNFLDVPTDCPQRDERMGWTGDAQIFASTAGFNMYSSAFFSKYMHDLREEQRRIGGSVPFIVPSIKPEGENGFVTFNGSAAWGDAATIIPWTLYLHYGDKELLRQQFHTMKDWVDYIKRADDESGAGRLWQVGFHLGDWLALDGDDPSGFMGGTDPYYIASAYYCYSSRLVAKAAAALGDTATAEEYGRLADEIKAAISNEYFTVNGKCAIDTQTALIVALYMDLVPDSYRPRIIEDLRKRLARDEMHIKTGFVGTPYFCHALSDNGASEDAYTLLLNDDYPSWLYAVKLGATTIWERWNSVLPDGEISGTGMNSLNHYAYGSIVEWMYRHMCGINPAEDGAGYKRIHFAPKPDARLKYAKASLYSASGYIESSWKWKADGSLSFTFTVPFNTTAEVTLPDGNLQDVTVNGEKLSDCGMAAEQAGTNTKCELSPGTYLFEYMPARSYFKKIAGSSTVREILSNNQARAMFKQLLPEVDGNSMLLNRVMNLKVEELPSDRLAANFVSPEKIDQLLEKLMQ